MKKKEYTILDRLEKQEVVQIFLVKVPVYPNNYFMRFEEQRKDGSIQVIKPKDLRILQLHMNTQIALPKWFFVKFNKQRREIAKKN